MVCKNRFQIRSQISLSPEEVYSWHLRDRILERSISLYGGFTSFSFEEHPSYDGLKLAVRVKILGIFSTVFNLEQIDCALNKSLTVFSKNKVFKRLKYKMVIAAQRDHTLKVIDYFSFSHNLPRILNPWINRLFKKRVRRALTYKYEMMDHDIEVLKRYPFKKPLRVLISGSHGLIGKSLAYFLEFSGHDVWRLFRYSSNKEKAIVWNPKTEKCDTSPFEGFDVVVHLAGENIGKGRWTKKKKKCVLRSRCQGTKNLVQILKKLEKPPKTFILASAIGYYGDCGSKMIDETFAPGSSLFISEVCREWERAPEELKEKGVRVVYTRFGVVLSPAGGALKKMLTPFKWGFGGKFGSGHQYVSWVAIDDVVSSIYHVMFTPSLQGGVNVVAPNPVSNDTLTKKLSKQLNRWRGPRLPAFVVRLIFGQKGKELLLMSARVKPQRLIESGYHFRYPELSQALKHVII